VEKSIQKTDFSTPINGIGDRNDIFQLFSTRRFYFSSLSFLQSLLFSCFSFARRLSITIAKGSIAYGG
jgi:hypothetical protein